jgi:hypothetical protein
LSIEKNRGRGETNIYFKISLDLFLYLDKQMVLGCHYLVLVLDIFSLDILFFNVILINFIMERERSLKNKTPKKYGV